jgi:hypothetical protein
MLTLKEKFSSFPADSIIEKIIFLEHLCCNGNISSVVLLSVFLITFLFPSLTEKIIKMVPLQKGHFRRHNWKIKHHLTCGRALQRRKNAFNKDVGEPPRGLPQNNSGRLHL